MSSQSAGKKRLASTLSEFHAPAPWVPESLFDNAQSVKNAVLSILKVTLFLSSKRLLTSL